MKKQLILIFLMLSAFCSANAQNINYTYDKAGRLTKVTYPNQQEVSYTYDADGNRIQKTVSRIVTHVEDETIQERHITIFPNPTNGIFTTQIQSTVFENLVVEIYTITGERLVSYSVIINRGISDIQMKIDPIVSGTYIVMVRGETFHASEKVVLISN
ncbi:MAG: T9SS type A sorting domain-containing protein [Chitinophagales bacterium]|nr:T9SS type A sorting domain-containing protein [Chitinophagales bacterium]